MRVAIEEEDLELERRRERVVVDNCQMRVCGDRWVNVGEGGGGGGGGGGAKVKHLKGNLGLNFFHTHSLTMQSVWHGLWGGGSELADCSARKRLQTSQTEHTQSQKGQEANR